MEPEQKLTQLETEFETMKLLLAALTNLTNDPTLERLLDSEAARDRTIDQLLVAHQNTADQLDRLTQPARDEFQHLVDRQENTDLNLERLAEQVQRSMQLQQDNQGAIVQIADKLERTQLCIEALITGVTRLSQYAEQAAAEQAEVKRTIAHLAEQTAADRQETAIDRTNSKYRWEQTHAEIERIWGYLSQQQQADRTQPD